MISIALSFDSGILFCAAAKGSSPVRASSESTSIFPRQYGPNTGGACSIFMLSQPNDCAVAAVQYCECTLDILQPAELTIDQMRATIENSLTEIYRRQPATPILIALYSSRQGQYSAFSTNGGTLKELAGYDCQGSSAYLGHYLIRDRYRALQSMDALDLRSVFAVAAETLDGIKELREECCECAEILVLFADGRRSQVHHLSPGTCEPPELALSAICGPDSIHFDPAAT